MGKTRSKQQHQAGTSSSSNKKRRVGSSAKDAHRNHASGSTATTKSPVITNSEDLLQKRCDNAKACLCHVFDTLCSSSSVGVTLWDKLSESWKQDKDIAFAAATNRHIQLQDLPACLYADEDFLVSVIQKEPRKWNDIPESYKKDPVYAQFITKFPRDGRLVQQVVEGCPKICNDWEFWSRVISHIPPPDGNRGKYNTNLLVELAPSWVFSDLELMRTACRQTFIIMAHVQQPALNDTELWRIYFEVQKHDLFLDPMPLPIRGNKELMLKACRISSSYLHYVAPSFLEKRDFVEELLEKEARVLAYLPEDVQRLFPDLVEQCLTTCTIDKLPTETQQLMVRNLNDDFWCHEDFVKKWFKAGGHFFRNLFPSQWRENEEVFLWLALHGTERTWLHAFSNELSEEKHDDKAFAMRMVSTQPFIYWCFYHDSVKTDYEIALLSSVSAMGIPNMDRWIEETEEEGEFDYVRWEFFKPFCEKVHERWEIGSAFPGAIMAENGEELPGEELPHVRMNSNPFLSLWQEGEGSFTKLIRDFIDMPDAYEFALLEQAVQHLPREPDINDYPATD